MYQKICPLQFWVPNVVLIWYLFHENGVPNRQCLRNQVQESSSEVGQIMSPIISTSMSECCKIMSKLWKQQSCPIPFSLSPCESRLFWQNQLAELIFKKKKPRQNWSRGHFEATQKANFSILKPNFWSGDTAMGMAHWHNPKRVNFFSNILQNHYFVRWNSYFYQHCSGWLFFANFQTRISYFFTMGLSPCTAWVGDRYIGEVISPFRTLPWQKMTAQFQFFQSLPHKKADFVKKGR